MKNSEYNSKFESVVCPSVALITFFKRFGMKSVSFFAVFSLPECRNSWITAWVVFVLLVQSFFKLWAYKLRTIFLQDSRPVNFLASRHVLLFSSKYIFTIFDVCHWAESGWKIALTLLLNFSSSSNNLFSNSLLYFSVFIIPSIRTRDPILIYEKQPRNIFFEGVWLLDQYKL